MARKIEVHIVDDLDGSRADETLRFALDGVSYEIDVSARHATKLRTSLETYINAARRIGRAPVAANRTRAAAPSRVDRARNQAIREWAKRQGIQLSDRGRIPTTIVRQYEAEADR